MFMIAVSSSLFIVCLSGCDFTYICVVVCAKELTMDAPLSRFWGTIRVYVVEWVPCRLEWPDGVTCVVAGSCGTFWIGVSV